jgi:hypothetical protein
MTYSTEPVNLILTILEYTNGEYSPKQIMELYYFIKSVEHEHTSSASLSVIKGK